MKIIIGVIVLTFCLGGWYLYYLTTPDAQLYDFYHNEHKENFLILPLFVKGDDIVQL